MLNFKIRKPNSDESKLNECIDTLFEEMNSLDGSSPNYSDTADQLVKLMELKKKNNPSWRPSPDAIIGAVASVIGIVLVLHYEKAGVVTSKALNFIGKMK